MLEDPVAVRKITAEKEKAAAVMDGCLVCEGRLGMWGTVAVSEQAPAGRRQRYQLNVDVASLSTGRSVGLLIPSHGSE